MSKNTALVVRKPGEAEAAEVSIPKLRDDYIIIKVKAVALNPTDWKHIDFLTSNGAIVSDPGEHGFLDSVPDPNLSLPHLTPWLMKRTDRM